MSVSGKKNGHQTVLPDNIVYITIAPPGITSLNKFHPFHQVQNLTIATQFYFNCRSMDDRYQHVTV